MANEEDFLALMQKHQGILYKLTRIYAFNREDEEDLRQEIVLQAWRSFTSFRGEAKFSTWLYRVGLNTAMTFTRKQQKELSLSTELKESSSGVDEYSRELLIAHIRELNDGDKLIIMLHLDGYPNHEIAAIAGINKSHVAVKLHRIKEKLAQKIKVEL